MAYNFFQKDKLYHNIPLYKKFGLNKSYFSPVSSNDFKDIDASIANDMPFNKKPEDTTIFKNSDNETQNCILNYNDTGYVILRNYLNANQADSVNQEIDKLLKEKKVKFKYGNKIMFALHQSNMIKNIGNDKNLIEFLSSLLGTQVKLFQSINFLTGSQQKTHSDSIHMTTFPLGGLFGAWFALEDIDIDNGALHYYPGSHKLPYYLNSDYDNEGNYFLIGKKDYSEYEKMIEEKIEEHKIKKQIFTAKKGDLLIWHANLLHGGEAHSNKNKTRKSMVFHYFSTNCVCYHEITQRPALIHNSLL